MTRVVVALVAIPAVLGIAYVGGLPLALLLALASALAAWEFYRIAAAGAYDPFSALGIGISALTPIAVHFFRLGMFKPPVIALGAMLLVALFAVAIFRRPPEGRPIGAIASTWLGIGYTGGLLSFAYALRYHNYTVTPAAGLAVVGYPLILTWISDTAAFFVGRSIGRRRLMPRISPAKTVEGAVGAVATCMVASVAYVHLVLEPLASLSVEAVVALLVGAALSIAVQAGDLAESLLKREAGVKDSSTLLPGHGGILDRLDGLLFALPTAYLLFTFPHVLLFVTK